MTRPYTVATIRRAVLACILCVIITASRGAASNGPASSRHLTEGDAFHPGEIMALHLPVHPDLTAQEPTDAYAAICTVAKDVQAKVRAWVLYHRWLGVGKVYLYDHGSEPPLLEFVEDLVKEGYVEYQYFVGHHEPAGHFIQTAAGHAYNDCLLRNRMKHRWMGFFEVDEYLVFYQKDITDISSFLREYEPFGGLGVNWLTFAGSGDQEDPAVGGLAANTRCLAAFSKLNQRVKLFVNPRYTLGFYDSSHTVSFTGPNMTVVSDVLKEAHAGTTEPPYYTKVALHRYPCSTEHSCDGALAALFPTATNTAGAEGTGQCTRGTEVARTFLEATGANLHWRQLPRSDPPSRTPRMTVFPKH